MAKSFSMEAHAARTRWSAVLGLLLGLLFLAAAGCTVRLIADYDEQTDQAVMALQEEIESFLVNQERVFGTPEAEYARWTDAYDRFRVAIRSLRVRSEARPQNEITVQHLVLLEESLDNLERLHELGFESREEFTPLRDAFHRSFTAILKLELAKRRGQ